MKRAIIIHNDNTDNIKKDSNIHNKIYANKNISNLT